MRKITIEDISRDTGLSRGTVSRALNDKPDISVQTKQRVMEAVTRLKYVPSHAARSLATGRNFAVTVLVGDLQSTLNAGILRGIMGQAHAAHYMVEVIETGTNSIADSLGSLSPERVDAVLNVAPFEQHDALQLKNAVENRLLCSTWPLEGINGDTFTPDFAEAGRIAARVFLRNGIREILYIHTPNQPGANAQLNGFQEICRENGINPEDSTATIEGLPDFERIQARIQRARGIAAANDFLACAAQMRVLAEGRKPGADVAIIGFGNEPISRQISPDLTTLDAAGEEIGSRMMGTLLQRLSNERSDNPEYTRIAPVLIRRGTTQHLSTD